MAKKKSKKLKRVHPVTPLDPDLEAQFRHTVEFYSTGKGEVIAQPPMQDVLADMIPKVMEEQLKGIDAYKRGEFSPSLQRKFVALLKLAIKRYPTN